MTWHLDKGRPLCPQIGEQLCLQIALGHFKPHQRLFSVREAAMAAGVNPNTVSKAYLELERLGILVGAAGKGYFVSPGAYTRLREKTVAEEKKAFLDASRQLMQNGITESQLTDWLRELFSEGGTHV